MVFEIKSGIKNLNITLNQFVPHYLVITLLCLDSISIYDDDWIGGRLCIGQSAEQGCLVSKLGMIWGDGEMGRGGRTGRAVL